MAKRTNQRDGVVIKRLSSGAWQYRVWDARAGKYRSRNLWRDPQVDGNRSIPGCAAGDAWAAETTATYALGQRSAENISIAALGELYAEDRERREVSAGYLRSIRNAVAIMVAGGLPGLRSDGVAMVAQRIIDRHTANRPGQKTRKPVTARTKNAQVNILRSMSRWGARKGVIDRDVFAGLDTYREKDSKVRDVYTVPELRTMLRATTDPWWSFVALVALSGVRSETARAITWSMIDFEAKRIRLPASIMKTNVDSRIPLQPELADILHEWGPQHPTATLLPSTIASINSDRANLEMQAFLKRCGIEPSGRSVHCLRHSVAGMLTATNWSPFLVMDALSHRNLSTSKHYARYAEAYVDLVRAENWPEGRLCLLNPPGSAKVTGEQRG